MKKKMDLNQLKVKSFVTGGKEKSGTVKGGYCHPNTDTTPLDSVEPEFCDWTCNRWCVSNGNCNTYEVWCTAPY